MQKLSRYNPGINFIFVAVDTQSRFVWVSPLKKTTAAECKDALQKIKESLRSKKVSSKTMMMMKSMFCRSKSNTLPKPEKIWVDKGVEFACEFSHFCRENDIGLYSTHSETKSAFAERNIPSLKAIIFKFLHENNTDTYFENLQQFVNVINCRVNRIIKSAPKDVGKNDVPYLISFQCCNQIRQPNYKMGQQVRMKRKSDTFHRRYRIHFTEEVFTIAAVQTRNPPTYSIKDANNQLIQGKLYEAEVTPFEN